MKVFFQDSHCLDMMVFKSLRRIRPNWLVLWDEQHNSYQNEPFSFGFEFNYLIDELESVPDQLGITQKQLELLTILSRHPLPHDTLGINHYYIELLKRGFYTDIKGTDIIQLIAILIHQYKSAGYLHVDDITDNDKNKLGMLICLVLYDWYRLMEPKRLN